MVTTMISLGLNDTELRMFTRTDEYDQLTIGQLGSQIIVSMTPEQRKALALFLSEYDQTVHRSVTSQDRMTILRSE